MSLRTIAGALGIILTAFGVIVPLPILIALIFKEHQAIPPFLIAAALSLGLGRLCRRYGRFGRNFDNIKRSEGLLIVTLTWIVVAAIGAIPFLFFGLSPLDAYFESVSGFTTTGATILLDFSLYPQTFFFWRSLTQWLGGMGIIVLFVAILPQLGVAGRRIFFAEAPGPTEDKLTPRVAHTAKSLWFIYLVLTVLEIALLFLADMPLFDAVCNSLSTMAAGGFSPHPQSIMGYQSSAITWIVTVFMVLAGANFALQYKCFFKGKGRTLFGNDEFRLYLTITAAASLLLAVFIYAIPGGEVMTSLRDGTFQVVSILTTTGFASADFALWAVPAQAVLFAMMLIGGCAGSAGGGVKVIRVLFVGRFLKREIDQLVHPKAVLPIKIDRMTVPEDIQRQMLSFVFFYLVLMLFSGLAVTMIEANAVIGFVGTAATIGNVGPGFAEIGPMASFGTLHWMTKCIFTLNMIVGRLELIPFVAMLCPEFWTMSRS
jgi:trk system potassium uptake protein TrkH